MVRPLRHLAPLVAAAWACGAAADEAGLPLVIATGSEAGVYFPLGSVLAEEWTRGIDGLDVVAEPTGGSIANVQFVHEGEAAFALVQTDIARYAYMGEEMFEGAAVDGYGALAVLYPEPVQIVALAGAGVRSVADLAGLRVAVGARGSGTEANAWQILEAHGLGPDDLQAVALSFEDAATALRDEHIHAAFLTAGVPTRAVADLSELHGLDVALVPLEEERVAALVERWHFYVPEALPAGIYPGTDATTTVSVRAMLIARDEIPEDDVARALEILYDAATLDRLCRTHVRGCDIRTAGPDPDAAPIPLHPGAKRYYAAR